ncbi:hypothetical protein E5F05_01570 (plasmid) [Deinococcus metallilatus]|uniref:Glycosyl-4,4'-diaponeurosporenoate acyltransferase n=1 Tax=Deinococcus metallilatus TaxID=1211322 RepID=A0ABR6MZ69_9DEIO|nr:hypothetical protein [Deinococcus metallilatus]MBB5296964.1 hypothetical protein [Deinococcus metallilatus]QBY06668.1 hypothetical protein E5F05_01570 [Deinococcus metallilatus]GMA15137.1 hypothetical protein GCM10025871_14680 [Deinococcus metallilatus]
MVARLPRRADEHHAGAGAALNARALGVLPGLLAVLALSVSAQRRLGWHGLPLALSMQVLLMWWALYLLWAVPLPLRAGWFRVRAWETPLYRRLGVYGYMRLLRAVGWERLRRGAQGFDGTRATLRHYERRTREAEFSHVLLGGITASLVLLTGLRGQGETAGWLLATGLFFHAYPVMLQRTLRERLTRLGVSG